MKDRYDQFCLKSIESLSRIFPNDCLKLKVFVDDNFRVDENGRKFSKQAENTVAKGEIARFCIFSFSYSVFKILLLQTRKNKGLFWRGLNTQKSRKK